MMIPLNFVHFNHFSSSDPFFFIKDLDRIFNIGEVWFYPYFFLFNNFSRNSDTLFELRGMKDIIDGCKLWRNSHSIGHRSTNFGDFIWTDISGGLISLSLQTFAQP
jgi:hypothetical protein